MSYTVHSQNALPSWLCIGGASPLGTSGPTGHGGLEKERQSGRPHAARYQTTQGHVVETAPRRHENRRTGQWERTERPETDLIYTIGSSTRRVKTVSSLNGGGETGHVMQKNETEPPFYTVCENKLRTDYRLKCKTQNIKLLE